MGRALCAPDAKCISTQRESTVPPAASKLDVGRGRPGVHQGFLHHDTAQRPSLPEISPGSSTFNRKTQSPYTATVGNSYLLVTTSTVTPTTHPLPTPQKKQQKSLKTLGAPHQDCLLLPRTQAQQSCSSPTAQTWAPASPAENRDTPGRGLAGTRQQSGSAGTEGHVQRDVTKTDDDYQ